MKISINIFTVVVFFFIVFMAIFGPNILQLRGFGDTSFITCVLIFFFTLMKGIKINWYIVLLALPIFLTHTFLAFNSSLSISAEPMYYLELLLKPIRILGVLMGSYCVVILLNRYNPHISILRLVFYAVSLHAFIMIIQLISIDFRDFIYGYLNSGNYRSTFDYQFRMGGLSGGSGGAVLSVVQSTGVILAPFVLRERQNKTSKIFIYICIILCFLSVIISGRSGLLSIIIFYPIAILMLSNNVFKTLLNLFLLLFLFISIVAGVSILMDFLYSGEAEEGGTIYSVATSISRTFDSILLIISSGNIEDSTITTLIGQITLPDSFKTLIFGDPSTVFVNQLNREVDSDIGYIRNIWGFGILLSILYWSVLLLMQTKLLLSNNHTNVKHAAFIIGMIMILFHAKELFYYVRMLFPIYCILYYQALFIKNNFEEHYRNIGVVK